VAVSGSTVAIAGRSVWVSRDTGTTWAEVKQPVTGPRQGTALYAATRDLIYLATTAGQVFTLAPSGWTRPAGSGSP
jgi:hypothetical protein